MPTKTTSPSRSSRAAAVTISSLGVMSITRRSIAVVDGARRPRRGAQAGQPLPHPGRVLGAAGDAIDPLVQPARQRPLVLGDLAPAEVEVVVPVVVALGEGGVAPPRLVHYGVDHEAGQQGAIGIGAHHALVDDLLGEDR